MTSRPLRCRLGFHTAERSQGVVGYCLRGCGDLKREHCGRKVWTLYVTKPPEGSRPPGLPRRRDDGADR
jgi:hypothetical protein